MSELIKISYEAWEEIYKPIENPFAPGSQMFPIPCSDEEREFLQSIDVSRIWSYGSGEYGGTYIWSGEVAQGLENFGAYVTEIGYQDESILEIEIFEPEYTCPKCEINYVGDLAVEQRKRFEDACEDCGVIYSCNTCGTEVDHDTPCPNGCDEETTEIVNRILGEEAK
jgi:hypothetical protein